MSNSRTKEEDKEIMVNAGMLGVPPKEVIEKMASYLDTPSSATFLRSTCRFFARNQKLLDIVKSNQKVFASDDYTFILNSRGSLYGLGNFPSYLVGDNKRGCIPIILPDRQPIAQIACTKSETIILTEEGTVYGVGINKHGQLGLGHQSEQLTLTSISVPGNERIIHVALHNETLMLLADGGTVFGCGQNVHGNLGLEDRVNRSTLVTIPLPENTRIKNIALGHNHVIMLTEEGRVYGCGSNHLKQLSLGDSTYSKLTSIPVPEDKSIQQIEATKNGMILLATDGTVYACGQIHTSLFEFSSIKGFKVFSKFKLIPVPDNKPIQYISGTACGLLLLARDGSAYCCGFDFIHTLTYNSSAHGSCISIFNDNHIKIKQMSKGHNHSILVTDKGIVYGYGANDFGQLGPEVSMTYGTSIPTRINIADLLPQAVQEEKTKLRM
jgi:alpha-tubulin suppressor-like RCC1 family protein